MLSVTDPSRSHPSAMVHPLEGNVSALDNTVSFSCNMLHDCIGLVHDAVDAESGTEWVVKPMRYLRWIRGPELEWMK